MSRTVGCSDERGQQVEIVTDTAFGLVFVIATRIAALHGFIIIMPAANLLAGS